MAAKRPNRAGSGVDRAARGPAGGAEPTRDAPAPGAGDLPPGEALLGWREALDRLLDDDAALVARIHEGLSAFRGELLGRADPERPFRRERLRDRVLAVLGVPSPLDEADRATVNRARAAVEMEIERQVALRWLWPVHRRWRSKGLRDAREELAEQLLQLSLEAQRGGPPAAPGLRPATRLGSLRTAVGAAPWSKAAAKPKTRKPTGRPPTLCLEIEPGTNRLLIGGQPLCPTGGKPLSAQLRRYRDGRDPLGREARLLIVLALESLGLAVTDAARAPTSRAAVSRVKRALLDSKAPVELLEPREGPVLSGQLALSPALLALGRTLGWIE